MGVGVGITKTSATPITLQMCRWQPQDMELRYAVSSMVLTQACYHNWKIVNPFKLSEYLHSNIINKGHML